MSSNTGKSKREDEHMDEGNPLSIPLIQTTPTTEEIAPDTATAESGASEQPKDEGGGTKSGKEQEDKDGDSKKPINEEKKEPKEQASDGEQTTSKSDKIETQKKNSVEGSIKTDKEEAAEENEDEKEGGELVNGVQGRGKARRIGTTIAPPMSQGTRHRKISFADDVEQRSFTSSGDGVDIEPRETTDLTHEVIPEVEDGEEGGEFTPKVRRGQVDGEHMKDRYPFLSKREGRFSTTSWFSITSRPSFSGLASRPSMVSIKSTLSRAHSELYPERGSFIATSLGQSFADLPAPIAQKLYIVTQVLAAVSVSIGSMAVGFNAAYTSPALASMDEANSTLTLTEEQKSWVGSLMPLSALTGGLIGGYLVDALGRKMLILVCGPPFFTALIIIGSAVNVWMLYVGRAIAGLCVGLLTLTLPVYLGETIQPEIRGTLGLLPTTIGNVGILVCFVVGSYVNWSWLAYIGALIPLVFFCMMIFVPETPRWYVSKGHDENAERSLQWLRGSDNDVELELEAIQKNLEMSNQQSSSLKDLFTKQYLKPVGISIGLMLVQQLSGINAVIFYTVDIFKLSGSTIDGNLSTIIVGIVNFISTIFANGLIDKLGRKILLYVSDVAMIVSLFALGSYFFVKSLGNVEDPDNEWNSTVQTLSWLPLLSFMIYVIAFSLGWGPIPWLFMGEALPAKIRGPAASLVTAFNWGCTFIVTKTFPGMIKSLGPHGVFFMFGVVMVIGFFFTLFFVPETKGKTLEEIEEEISGKPRRQRRISEMSGIMIK